MTDRLEKITKGIKAAGGGAFTIVLRSDGEWQTAAEYGSESPDSPMVGAASYGAASDSDIAIQQILVETRWDEL